MLDFGSIEGDPDDLKTRTNLVEFLNNREFKTQSGRRLKVRGWMVDLGGHRTDSVYKMVKGRAGQRIFACKGANTAGNPIFSGWRLHKESRIRWALVGTDTAKETIYARLSKDPDEAGRIHFHESLEMSYFEGLVSEERKIVMV